MRVRLVMFRAITIFFTNFKEKCKCNKILMDNRTRQGCSTSKTLDSVSNLTLKTWRKKHYLNQSRTNAASTRTLMLCHFTSQKNCQNMVSEWLLGVKISRSTWSERKRTKMSTKLLADKLANQTLQDSYKRKKRKMMSNLKCMLKNTKKSRELKISISIKNLNRKENKRKVH